MAASTAHLSSSRTSPVVNLAVLPRDRGRPSLASRLASLLVAIAVLVAESAGPSAERRPLRLDLSVLFGPDGVTRDTNGDGLADRAATRIVLPSSPTVDDSLAAANLAARVGFETTALSLPILARDTDSSAGATDLPIFVGRTNRYVRDLAAADAIEVDDLAAGQGLVAMVPSPAGDGMALVVAGVDDKGTLAAAQVVAGRLPRVWNMTGVTLSGVASQVRAFLASKGVQVHDSVASSFVVDADKRGIARVRVDAFVDAPLVSRAVSALQALDGQHRRGLEPQTLNFAEVAATVVSFNPAGAGAATTSATVARAGLNGRTLTPPIDPNELAVDSPGERGRPADGGGARGKTFDLANPYSIEGWFGDAYTDLIPDRTDTSIVVGGPAEASGAAAIAARLGLETTGLTFPIAKSQDDVRDPSRESNPVLVGRDNRLVDALVRVGRARLDDLRPGEGVVQIVPRAFGSTTATVVAGADPTGGEAASQFLARRIPYVWDNRRGALSFEDVRTELGRFLGGKSASGQAAQALRELSDIAVELRSQRKPIASFDATVSLEAENPALDAFLTNELRATLGDAKITVKSQTITAPTPVIDETIDVPWEVDEFWAKVRADVVPKVKPGATVTLEARLSESPELRASLANEVRAELLKAGAKATDVRILSAYKQGFLWLTEQIIPRLKGTGARSVHIKVAEYEPDLSKKFKFYQVPSRWLHELYPVDEIVQSQLGIPKNAFSLELVKAPTDIYVVEAKDAAGRIVLTDHFSPKFVEREYLDKFPGWSRVDVTTGWLSAAVDGQSVVDGRIQTDPERFWDRYQSAILPRIYDHVMKVTENRPLPEKQPFHRDLDVEVWMSEPDFKIGVDEELVSALESLHEDLYFVTLDFFDALGRTTTRRRLAAPGKIYPIIHPERRGQGGRVHVLYAGNTATKPQLEVRYTEAGASKPEQVRRDLGRIDTSAPEALRAVVRVDGVSEIELHVDAKDDREAARATDALDALGRLHAAGLYRDALSYEHVDRVAVSVAQRDTRTRRTLTATGAWAPSNVRQPGERPSLPLVTWDHIIGPDESEALVGKLAAFPEVRAYKAGRSYRGREISAVEITAPADGELVSRAKLSALKPTILITGRQHANEVSSTSHVLKLAELLVSDPTYKAILKKVNVILHPVENPDGAQMAYDLQKLTPTHMLHAGRYSALGMDVASQVGVAEPLLPEALVRTRLWLDWLPDIYLNPHGYPSHEWVQQFAGYVPPGFRTYWTTRGWYTTMSALRDPREPEHLESVAAIRDAVVREVNGDPDVRAMNLRSQARYRRWAYGFAPFVYGQEIYKDTAIYYSDMETGEVRGPRRAGAARFGGDGGGGSGRFSMNQWPQVTFVSGGTESPDETAQGAWLELATKPGLAYVMAHVKFLRDGRYTVERIEEDGQRDTTSITLTRVRPVRPPGGSVKTPRP
ncbi:MAG: M14 family metallopeptidase [Vicinamibacterales bacterium]